MPELLTSGRFAATRTDSSGTHIRIFDTLTDAEEWEQG